MIRNPYFKSTLRIRANDEWDLWEQGARKMNRPKEELTLYCATPFHGAWEKKYGGEWVKVGEWENRKGKKGAGTDIAAQMRDR